MIVWDNDFATLIADDLQSPVRVWINEIDEERRLAWVAIQDVEDLDFEITETTRRVSFDQLIMEP